MNVLSLFSGIGGLELGLERAGMTVVGQVEIDPYCQRVLAKHWPEVPRHDDVRTCVKWWRSEPRPAIDLICGGFPCQDISNAGQRAGIVHGERSSLWSAMAWVIRALRPRYILVENVAALLVRGFDVVQTDLAALGYDTDWDCIPAAAVGAPHLRDRVFLLAHAQREQLRQQPIREPGCGSTPIARDDGSAGPLAYATSQRRRSRRPGRPTGHGENRAVKRPQALVNTDRKPLVWAPVTRPERDSWAIEPDVGRVVNGVPTELDKARRRALGNAVVPQVAQHVGQLIMAAERGAA